MAADERPPKSTGGILQEDSLVKLLQDPKNPRRGSSPLSNPIGVHPRSSAAIRLFYSCTPAQKRKWPPMNADLELTNDSLPLDFRSLKVDQQGKVMAGCLKVIEALSGVFL
jgi:hypothetical protein